MIMNASVEQKAAAVASISESQDYVVQLLAVVFQAMEMEKAAMMAEICHAWSPQVPLLITKVLLTPTLSGLKHPSSSEFK